MTRRIVRLEIVAQFAIGLSTAAAVLMSAGIAQAQLACEPKAALGVGQPVEVEYLFEWYPAEIIAYQPDKGEYPYQIRYPDGREVWKREVDLRPAGSPALELPFSLRVEDTLGNWGLSSGATTSTIEGDELWLESVYAPVGELTIHPDGTYTWMDAGTPIEGTWETNPNPQRHNGPVILRNGANGMDWSVNFDGRLGDGSYMIYLNSNQGYELSGFRKC